MLEDGTILGTREFHRYYKQRKPEMLFQKESRGEGEVRRRLVSDAGGGKGGGGELGGGASSEEAEGRGGQGEGNAGAEQVRDL